MADLELGLLTLYWWSSLQFSEGKVAPPGARIVYIDGAFDLFHPGHVKILKVLSASLSPLLATATCILI